jgi:hypothetical protein
MILYISKQNRRFLMFSPQRNDTCLARHWWLTSAILPSWEAEMGRIMVWGLSRQIVLFIIALLELPKTGNDLNVFQWAVAKQTGPFTQWDSTRNEKNGKILLDIILTSTNLTWTAIWVHFWTKGMFGKTSKTSVFNCKYYKA